MVLFWDAVVPRDGSGLHSITAGESTTFRSLEWGFSGLLDHPNAFPRIPSHAGPYWHLLFFNTVAVIKGCTHGAAGKANILQWKKTQLFQLPQEGANIHCLFQTHSPQRLWMWREPDSYPKSALMNFLGCCFWNKSSHKEQSCPWGMFWLWVLIKWMLSWTSRLWHVLQQALQWQVYWMSASFGLNKGGGGWQGRVLKLNAQYGKGE